jgi:hypothetical protein
MQRLIAVTAFVVLSFAAGTLVVNAQDTTRVSQQYVEIKWVDGSTIQGQLVAEDDKSVTIRTSMGYDVIFPRDKIESITPLRGKVTAGGFRRADRNYSRLLLAPTGRPLRTGDGYFTDAYIFFPAFAYGFTANISVLGGFSIFPGLGIRKQFYYLAPRVGVRTSDRLALSGGLLYVTRGEDDGRFSAGMLFAVGTYGSEEFNLTGGMGLGYSKKKGEDYKFAEYPVILIGGYARISNSLALVSENWIITGEAESDVQPFTLALRLLGDRLSADFGFIIMAAIVEEGFPIPWLSITYNFGK